jgi:AcrR family transcriptional regulator
MSVSERRTEFHESLREEILDAARRLFVLHGYESTSMRAIAAKAGCSPGMLYHYFEDKPSIMARLVRETFARMRRHLSEILRDHGPIQDRLRRGLRAYIDFGLQHEHHYALLFMKGDLDLKENAPILSAFVEDGYATFDCLRSLCREAIQTGLIREEIQDHEELTQALWVSIHGLVSLQISSKTFNWVERSRLIELQTDILMKGIVRDSIR